MHRRVLRLLESVARCKRKRGRSIFVWRVLICLLLASSVREKGRQGRCGDGLHSNRVAKLLWTQSERLDENRSVLAVNLTHFSRAHHSLKNTTNTCYLTERCKLSGAWAFFVFHVIPQSPFQFFHLLWKCCTAACNVRYYLQNLIRPKHATSISLLLSGWQPRNWEFRGARWKSALFGFIVY